MPVTTSQRDTDASTEHFTRCLRDTGFSEVVPVHRIKNSNLFVQQVEWRNMSMVWRRAKVRFCDWLVIGSPLDADEACPWMIMWRPLGRRSSCTRYVFFWESNLETPMNESDRSVFGIGILHCPLVPVLDELVHWVLGPFYGCWATNWFITKALNSSMGSNLMPSSPIFHHVWGLGSKIKKYL